MPEPAPEAQALADRMDEDERPLRADEPTTDT